MSERNKTNPFAKEVAAGRLEDYLAFLENVYGAYTFDSRRLEEEAGHLFEELTTGPVEEVKLVMALMGYLVVKTEIYDRRLEGSTDPQELESNLKLYDYFEGVMYGEVPVIEGLFEYCDGRCQADQENAPRWRMLAELIKGTLPLEKQIEIEIKKHSGELSFMPSEYAAYRRKGWSPEDIGYDLCHFF